MAAAGTGTAGEDYTERLRRKGAPRWKRVLDVQRPYRWNLRRLAPGFTLDLGCGLGRNLVHLDGNGVGIDHNPTSVASCRAAGLEAYTPEEFSASGRAAPATFDTLLVSHVVEHLDPADAAALVRDHLAYVRPGGKVILITPQRRGYASDATHVTYVDGDGLHAMADALGLRVEQRFSFPFPWPAVGRVFTYNEFVVVARLPAV
jgi:SAM-dependent methyltransferase